MLKSIFCGSFLLVSLFSFPVMVRSQATQLSVPNNAQAAASQAITPLELQQFVQVLKRWRGFDMEVQKRIVAAINAEHLTPQRFVEINDNQNKKPGSTEVSEEDVTKYKNIVAKIEEFEKVIQGKKEQAVTSQGLTIQRFNQIGAAAEQDPEMKQKVQLMLGEPIKPAPGKKQ